MKRMLITLTMALVALATLFPAAAEAGHKVEKAKKIKIVERTERIGGHHFATWQEYRGQRGVIVRHGTYTETLNGNIIVTGRYDNGVRDGEWTYWTTEGTYRIGRIVTYRDGVQISVYKPVYKPVVVRRKVVYRDYDRPHADIRIDSPRVHVRLGF